MADMIENIVWRRLFNVQPVVKAVGKALVIETSWKGHLLSFGAASRRVVANPQTKTVRIEGRRFWFARWSKVIPFDRVDAIEYGYANWNAGLAYQEQDVFTLNLRMKLGPPELLCRFVGGGDFVNNTSLPDFFFLESQLEARFSKGDQESGSLKVADLLSNMIGVPIENPSL